MYTTSFSLTVAESKKLIARGILKYQPVVNAIKKHSLLIGSGTTNSYIAAEIIGKDFKKQNFVTGRTLPQKSDKNRIFKYTEKPLKISNRKIERLDDLTKAYNDLKAGDVVLKGANAISGDGTKAGVLIGHNTGGGMGAMLGIVMARKVKLIHPVGIEKTIPADLEQISRLSRENSFSQGPSLFVSPGEVFNECHAVTAIFPGIKAWPYSAGGVAGAEGSVRILVEG
ncbi:MAG: hypothetical protein A2096_14125, partial [Spirochaetes bacterium GWF1_41_5]